jgi:LysM repeat protein
MRGRSRRSPMRLVAPLAIIAFVVAFLVVLSSSGVDHHSGASTTPTSTAPTGSSTTRTTSRFAHRRTYTVRAGDTLGAIAIKTGVSVTNLEDLNPGLDPEGLVAGQKLKLRE